MQKNSVENSADLLANINASLKNFHEYSSMNEGDFVVFILLINWLKVSLTSVVAFVVAITVCLLIEVFGGVVGGILGSIPSTVVPGSYVILTDAADAEQAISGMFAFPLGSACTSCLFLPVWKILPKYIPRTIPKWIRLVILSVVSTLIWAIGGVFLVWIQNLLPSIGVPIYVFSPIIVLITIIVGVIFCWHPAPAPKGKNKVSIWVHLTRGIVVAIFIFLSSIISAYGASDYAGLLTSFPAITIVTMLSVSISQDESVTCGAIGPLMLGYVSTCIYAYASCLLFVFTSLGIWWSMVIAFFFAVIIYSIPLYFFMQWRQRVCSSSCCHIETDIELKGTISPVPISISDNKDTTNEHSLSPDTNKNIDNNNNNEVPSVTVKAKDL
ncbi:hypothetical protein WA158_000697 [Blastocystis sp. Blastoise]